MIRFHLPKVPFKKNTFLFQIFIGLSLISIIIVTILSIMMFYWMKGRSLEEINKVNRMSLQNTDAVFSSFLKTFQNYSIELYQNPNIRKLMFLEELEWDDGTSNAVKHIQNILLVNRNIMNSVYVLNDKATILSISERFAESNADAQLFRMVSGHTSADSPLVWTMKDKYSDRPMKSMTFFHHQGALNRLDGATAINIDLEQLVKTIFSERTNQHQNMLIVDREGNIIVHSDMSKLQQNISSEPYFSKMLASNKDYDSYIVKRDNQAFTYSYIPSSNGRYFILSEMEDVHALSELVKTRNIILAYGLLMMILALFIAGLISYRLYKPFGQVVKGIRSIYKGEPDQHHHVGELQLVSNAFSKIVERMNTLEKENDSHTFIKLLNTEREEEPAFIESVFMKTGAVRTSETPYAVFVVRIDDFGSFSETSHVEAISFRLDSVMTILTQTLASRVESSLFTTAVDQVICIVSEPHDESELDPQPLTAIAEAAQQSVSSMLHVDISIGISSVTNEPSLVIEKYREALEITKHRVVQGTGWIASSSHLEALRSTDIPESVARDVLNAVKRGTFEPYMQGLDMAAVISRDYHYGSIVRFFAQLASSIIGLSQDLLGEENVQKKITFLEIYKKVSEFKEYEELKNWFTELFYQSNEVIQEILNKKTHDCLPEALEYINQHYCDPTISVNSVAESLNVSTSYFSKMFNESVGYTFPEYVNHLRMEKAKELLQDYPELNITDISTKVGFSSNSYFTTSFKKKYGVSPSKIRQIRKS